MTAIGIDTGSTSTDAVVYDLDNHRILTYAKTMTTHEDLEIGIREVLRRLPRELVDASSYISLSTTLATNACVEKKGENICLLFIGASKAAVEWTLSSYGFESMEFMRFISGDPDKGIEPDWAALDEMLPGIARHYDGVAVAQIGARTNDGLYERQAAERIAAFGDIPVTCSYEIFREVNVIKRGAGALLNARMSKVIAEFFRAIHAVLDEDDIDLPLLIMRSDGSLVSEEYTLRYPVETLVCGPTASVKGAAELFGERQAVVIDMGGTTSDMAIIRNGRPKIDSNGIRLAGWQTFVRGVSIDTLALGGDSRVWYSRRSISLDSRRVMPVSILASRFPEVLPELESTGEWYDGCSVALYEHFLLLKEIDDSDKRFSEDDRRICRLLRDGPKSVLQLAQATGTNKYSVRTERLEQLGAVLRCGFTPTDAFVLRGDAADMTCGAYGKLISENAARAAKLALGFISASTGRDGEWILDEIYRQVKEKLYCKIVQMLWSDAYGTERSPQPPKDLEKLAKQAFAEETSGEGTRFFRSTFSTDAVLLGAGAPIHVFLPDIAKALHTDWRVSEYSGVSNALGAVLGNVCVYETVHIKADYISPKTDENDGIFFIYGEKREAFDDIDVAIARAREIAADRAKVQAQRCGAKGDVTVTFEVKKKDFDTDFGLARIGADVTACARGKLL